MPDSNIMESLLFQLHYDSIAVSFIKVGSTFHPHSSAGYIAYTDLLDFFAHSTMGSCLENSPFIVRILKKNTFLNRFRKIVFSFQNLIRNSVYRLLLYAFIGHWPCPCRLYQTIGNYSKKDYINTRVIDNENLLLLFKFFN